MEINGVPPASLPLAESLRLVPLFESLPSESSECFHLLRRGEMETVGPGTIVACSGSVPDLIVVVSGMLVPRDPAQGHWGPGDHLGEIELLLDQSVPSDVLAATQSHLYRLSGDVFKAILVDCRLLVNHLLRQIASRVDRRPSA